MADEKNKAKEYMQRRLTEAMDDDAVMSAAEARLQEVLARAIQEGATGDDMAKRIEAFAKKDEASRRKVCLYCIDFFDPSAKSPVKEVVPQRFLSESDLAKVYAYVKKHELDKSFGEVVYELMDKHNMSAPQVYKNARMSRQDFSRITSPNCRGIKKTTVWSIILGLHCNLEEADALLYSAGFVRRNTKFDLIMEYFILNEIYDVWTVNDALNDSGLKILSANFAYE